MVVQNDSSTSDIKDHSLSSSNSSSGSNSLLQEVVDDKHVVQSRKLNTSIDYKDISSVYTTGNHYGAEEPDYEEHSNGIILKSITSTESTLLDKSSDKVLLNNEKVPQQRENLKKKTLIIVLIVNLAFPLYLAYNSPNSMVKIFDAHYKMNSEQFSKLYTVYALPNLFMVILGGILVDLFGPNKCSIVFQIILFLSSLLTAFSSITASYGLLLFSKVLLGIGGETILVCINSFIAKWFSAKDVPFVIGIESTWVQFASLLSFAVLPSLYKATNIQFTLWFIAIVSSTSLVSNILFVTFQKRLQYRTYISLQDDIEINSINDNKNEKEEETIKNGDSVNEIEGMTSSQRLVYELKQVVKLVRLIPMKMWIMAGVSFFGYSSFYGLDIIVTDMIIEKYGYSDTKAPLVMAYETFCTGIMGPVFGFMVKRYEMRATACAIGIFVMGLGIAILTLTTTAPYPWVIMSGLGYGLMNNTIMSSIPIIVDESIIGTSYGLVGTAYNVGIVVFPYILGACRARLGNYDLSMWILVLCAVVALMLLGWLKLIDMKEMDPSKRLDKKTIKK